MFNDHSQREEDSWFVESIYKGIDQQLVNLDKGLETWLDWKDYSIYTGTTGVALLYLRLFAARKESHYLERALFYVEKPLRHLKGRRVSFLCGDAGPLAVGAVIYDKLGQTEKAQECQHRLSALCDNVLHDTSLPDELLYGRVGYMYALLYVKQHIDHASVDHIIDKVYERIVSSGKSLSAKQGCQAPLMYEWHDKKYLGAAHGLVGIFYLLMQISRPAPDNTLHELIRPSLDYLLTLRFPSGNFPSSIGSPSGDKLVHWCHGAPGWLHMWIQAYKSFGEEKYLKEAVSCGDVIWQRGLLKKGYGICHGVAGNAYGFLALYKLTEDNKYLYRAQKFAEWCLDYGKHGCPTPDRPYSLFEGLAGTIYFLLDILDPKDAKFPAFEL